MGRTGFFDADTPMGVSPPGPARAGDTDERELSPAELAAVGDLVRLTAGIALTGPEGLLEAVRKNVIEAAVEEEVQHSCRA